MRNRFLSLRYVVMHALGGAGLLAREEMVRLTMAGDLRLKLSDHVPGNELVGQG